MPLKGIAVDPGDFPAVDLGRDREGCRSVRAAGDGDDIVAHRVIQTSIGERISAVQAVIRRVCGPVLLNDALCRGRRRFLCGRCRRRLFFLRGGLFLRWLFFPGRLLRFGRSLRGGLFRFRLGSFFDDDRLGIAGIFVGDRGQGHSCEQQDGQQQAYDAFCHFRHSFFFLTAVRVPGARPGRGRGCCPCPGRITDG